MASEQVGERDTVALMVSDWIWEENLRPFLEVTSWLAGYEFDDPDWDAVTVGLAQADRETTNPSNT